MPDKSNRDASSFSATRHSRSCVCKMGESFSLSTSRPRPMPSFGRTELGAFFIVTIILLSWIDGVNSAEHDIRSIHQFQIFPEHERLRLKEEARKMFYFGYDNYMRYAFPKDELNPIYCTGRGPDYDNPSNININDALGNYSLTLIDCLDTLVITGNISEFKNAVKLVLEYVSFDNDNVVQVFEATIRVLGGLIAAHLLIVDPSQPFGRLKPDHYDDDLLHMAHDLVNRLLPAFEKTKTGVPWPRVNLRNGVPLDCSQETCTAGAGTLLLEFGILGRLLSDPTLEGIARKSLQAIWDLRSNSTGLLGNVVNIETGEWVGKMSGLGAGVDSFYEYLLKSYIVFGDKSDLDKFNQIYKNINSQMRIGRQFCNNGTGSVPLFVNVHMTSGDLINPWIDSLQAAFPGVQVLRGDIEEAICSHMIYYAIWQKYGALPERFNWQTKTPDVSFYPLRPEFVESTYLLYQATKHPFYLHVGSEILKSLNTHTKAKCGYATIHNVLDKTLEDRMESFFLSETCKYLYLLFDRENPVNRDASNYIFSTEGHIFKLDSLYRKSPNADWTDDDKKTTVESVTFSFPPQNATQQCSSVAADLRSMRFSPFPIKEEYWKQIEEFVGL